MQKFHAPQAGSSMLAALVGISLLSLVAIGSASSLFAASRASKSMRTSDSASLVKATLAEELGSVFEDVYKRGTCASWDEWLRARATKVRLLGANPLMFTRDDAELSRLPGISRGDVRQLCSAPLFPSAGRTDGARLCFVLKGRSGSKTRSFLNGEDALVVVAARAKDALSGVTLNCGAGARRDSITIELAAEIYWRAERGVHRDGRARLWHSEVVTR